MCVGGGGGGVRNHLCTQVHSIVACPAFVYVYVYHYHLYIFFFLDLVATPNVSVLSVASLIITDEVGMPSTTLNPVVTAAAGCEDGTVTVFHPGNGKVSVATSVARNIATI